MNKKTLFFTLLGVILISPFTVSAVAPAGATTSLTGMAGSIKSALMTIGGSIVIIGWVIAGILWLTSGGSPEKTGTAKKAIVACVIGTVLIVLADASNTIITVIKDAFGITGGGVAP